MKELKTIGGFTLVVVALASMGAVSGALYRSNATMSVFVVIGLMSAVCLVVALALLESAGLYKWSKVIQLLFALALIVTAWDVSSAGMRTQRSQSLGSEGYKTIPMESDELLLLGLGTAVYLFAAMLLLVRTFMFRPMNPKVGRILKLSLGSILLLMVIPSVLEANRALNERPAAEITVPVKIAGVFIVEAALAGLALIVSGILRQPKKGVGGRG